jgi:hypothetical protein
MIIDMKKKRYLNFSNKILVDIRCGNNKYFGNIFKKCINNQILYHNKRNIIQITKFVNQKKIIINISNYKIEYKM